CQKYNTSPFIF
nr:immunoglobulin light chain junction region [Macaca mulatta]MOV76467.1 immunoglobulin light chain junction region [Macaca mulatta]MOV77182.1 immunoglobulin light chain junction region [Macaca mulatta]